MVVRIARILSACMILVLLFGISPAYCEGWTIWPFSSSSSNTKTTAPTRTVSKTTEKEPSLLDKTSQGTKNFFNKTGETLGLKKPEKKRPVAAYAKPPTLQKTQKKEKSLLPSWMQSKEPEAPKSVPEWMSTNKRSDL